MTPEEKQEIIDAVISQLLSDGCDITGLDAAQSLDGISTFPAVLTTTNNGVTTKALVSVPISLLTQSVQDVVTSANTAATSARSAAAGWAAAAVKMGSDIVVIEGDITNLQDADKSISTLTAYAECSTAANVSAKAVTVPYFSLPTSGGCLHIKMEHANTAVSGVTLNINSTEAIPLYYNGSAVSATNTWKANEVLEIYYDGTNYQATNAQGGGGSAEPSYVVPTWSGYVGASSATTASGLSLSSLTQYSNKSGIVNITVSSFSFIWFAVNCETIKVESNGIDVPIEYMGTQNSLYCFKTLERIASSISAELILLSETQGGGDSGGEGDDDTPVAATPTISTQPSSSTYNEGATPSALVVVASVSDGGTLSFQWYKGGVAFGSADSGTAVSGGYQSSCAPASSETASYYCVVTNNLSGATPSTATSNVATVTFSDSSQTDLTDFSIGYKINASTKDLEVDEEYCVSPWYDASEESDFSLCFVNRISNAKTNTPPVAWQSRRNETVSNGTYSNGGRRYDYDNGAEFRFVLKHSEADYCFINIGGSFVFKGSKVDKYNFLSKMGDLSTCFGKRLSYSDTTNRIVSYADNTGGSSTSNAAYSATWVTKAIELISGHVYRIYTGWTASTENTYKWFVATEQLSEQGGTVLQGKYGSTSDDAAKKVTGSSTAKYLYCNFALSQLENCYVYDETANEYVIRGADV